MELMGTDKHPLARATLLRSQAWSQEKHHQAHRTSRSHLRPNFATVDMLKTASAGVSGPWLCSVLPSAFAIMAS